MLNPDELRWDGFSTVSFPQDLGLRCLGHTSCRKSAFREEPLCLAFFIGDGFLRL